MCLWRFLSVGHPVGRWRYCTAPQSSWSQWRNKDVLAIAVLVGRMLGAMRCAAHEPSRAAGGYTQETGATGVRLGCTNSPRRGGQVRTSQTLPAAAEA